MIDPKVAALEAEVAEFDKQAFAMQTGQSLPQESVPAIAAPEVKEPVSEIVAPLQEEEIIEESKPVERKVYSMSVEKHQKQVENLKRSHDEEIARIRKEYESKSSVQPIIESKDDDVEKFAEEKGIDVSIVEGLLSIAEKRIASKIPQVDVSSIEELKKEREVEKARVQVSNDFDAKVLPLIRSQYPDASNEHIQSVKEKIQQLAFTKEYHAYPVEDIYAVKSRDFSFQSKVSAESSRGGHGATIDYESMNTEQLAKMSPQEAEKYFAYMDKKQGGSTYSN